MLLHTKFGEDQRLNKVWPPRDAPEPFLGGQMGGLKVKKLKDSLIAAKRLFPTKFGEDWSKIDF